MTRGIDTFYGPILSLDDIAMGEKVIGIKVHVAALLNLHSLLYFAGAMRTVGVGGRAGFGLQESAARRMIHMGMRDQYMTDFLAGQTGQNSVDMCFVIWAGINNRNLAGASGYRCLCHER